MKLRVRSVTYEAMDILSFELVDPEGRPLPTFEPGAHVDVRTPEGVCRPYSLCNASQERDCYRVAVLKTRTSRGGSASMHEHVRPGQMLEIGSPRNLFPLREGATHYILIAGGIGITPLVTMAERLASEGKSFVLHYCTRSPASTAFGERLRPLVERGLVHFHHDAGDAAKGLDVEALLRECLADAHIYFCGPPALMDAIKVAAAHWPADAVHHESFGAAFGPAASAGSAGAVPAGAQQIVLTRSAREIAIEPGSTVLQALRAAGVECTSSCEAGLCGTCMTGYSGGAVEHNDYVLSEHERASQMLVCTARVVAGPVLLDL
jgi:ferredoxin-NADP reductase